MQESFKICKKRSKILTDSCQILDNILHDISSRVTSERDLRDSNRDQANGDNTFYKQNCPSQVGKFALKVIVGNPSVQGLESIEAEGTKV